MRKTFPVMALAYSGPLLLHCLLCPVARGESRAMRGTPWKGNAAAVEETVGQIMARQEAANRLGLASAPITDVESAPRRSHVLKRPNQDSPALSRWPPSTAIVPARVAYSKRVPQTADLQFTGATLADAGSIPPDAMGAAGPSQFLVAVQGRIRVFDKATGGLGVLDASTDNFFASVRAGSGTSSPRVRYDRISGRWIVLMTNVAFPNNRILLAVSDTGTITGATVWQFFAFGQGDVSPAGQTNCLADFPTLGIDANALYIGANMFCGASPQSATYAGTSAWVVRKSSILGTGPIVASAFRDLTGGPDGAGPYTPQGVDNFDPTTSSGWFIACDNLSYGVLVLRQVTDPAGTPAMSANINLSVLSTAAPVLANHLGNAGSGPEPAGKIDPLDDRLAAAQMRGNHIWTTHNIGVQSDGVASETSANRTGTRWYEIAVTGASASLVQAGTLHDPTTPEDGDQRSYFVPSIAVSGQGHVAVGTSTAGTNEHLNAFTAGRLAGDPGGTLQSNGAPGSSPPYTASSSAYVPAADPGIAFARRWGRYSHTSVDPCDDMTMWTIQEFCDAESSWGVRAVRLLAPPPATPASAIPPTVPAGETSVEVVIVGSSASGSGFFDPGAGFACRLSGAVSGSGVTVSSASYTDPTHVVLNLSTVGAAQGTRDVTITNPDGQGMTGTGILTVGPCTIATPAVTAPATAMARRIGLVAGVAPQAGSTYAWTATNATITAGQGTNEITFTAGAPGTAVLAVVETNGAGCVSQPGTANVAVTPYAPIVDFSGDGKTDIVWRHSTTGDNALWYMDGATLIGGASAPSVPDLNWQIVGVGDFDGDGKADLVWRNSTTGENAVWFMDGPTLKGGAAIGVVDPAWKIVGTGDLNGDGHPDILWRNTATGDNVVWIMNGVTLVGGASLPPAADLAWGIVGIADFDGDGYPDIVWRNETTGSDTVWLMNGTTLIGGASLPPVPDLAWRIAALADFNADGMPDLLWSNATTGTNIIWFMNGTNIAGSQSLPTPSDSGWRIVGPK